MEDENIVVIDPTVPRWPFWGMLVSKTRPTPPRHLNPELVLLKPSQVDHFSRFSSMGSDALKILERRSLQDLEFAATEMQTEIDEWINYEIQQETDSHIKNIYENGGWELSYLPDGCQGSIDEIIDLFENWKSEWGKNSIPTPDDYTQLSALSELYHYELTDLFYLGLMEPEEDEAYALLTLIIICEAIHKNPRDYKRPVSTNDLIEVGKATIEALEAMAYAEKIRFETRIREAIASEQPAILEAAIASRVSERASKAALKTYSKNDTARRFVVNEWELHQDGYGQNKSAFCRHYVRLVVTEYGITITEKTMRDVWLKDNPTAGNRV